MNRLSGIVMMLLVGLPACTSGTSDTAYLREAQDRVTQEEIRQRWGEPKTVSSAEDGGSAWVYEKREQQAGNRFTMPGMWCDEYVLRFDRERVLREWSHRSYFHGGELMPKVCVPDAGSPRS